MPLLVSIILTYIVYLDIVIPTPSRYLGHPLLCMSGVDNKQNLLMWEAILHTLSLSACPSYLAHTSYLYLLDYIQMVSLPFCRDLCCL